jgi:cell division protein FtsB
VNEEGNGPKEQSPEEIEAELKRVEAERNELEARVETLEARPQKRQRVRRIFTPILVALSILVFTVTVPAVWGARTVLNTDRYVATVGPLAEDPAVQESIATKLTDQVFVALDVEEKLSEILGSIGERATVLAAPLTTAVKGFVQDQVLKVVQSDAFQTFWVAANRFVHTQVLAILRGEGETVSVVEGKVLLNLLPLVNLALGSIQRVATDLVGRDVTLPTIVEGEAPNESITKLEQALGVDLPDSYGQIVVYDSEDLEALQQTLSTL